MTTSRREFFREATGSDEAAALLEAIGRGDEGAAHALLVRGLDGQRAAAPPTGIEAHMAVVLRQGQSSGQRSTTLADLVREGVNEGVLRVGLKGTSAPVQTPLMPLADFIREAAGERPRAGYRAAAVPPPRPIDRHVQAMLGTTASGQRSLADHVREAVLEGAQVAYKGKSAPAPATTLAALTAAVKALTPQPAIARHVAALARATQQGGPR